MPRILRHWRYRRIDQHLGLRFWRHLSGRSGGGDLKCLIHGDFFGKEDVAEIANLLIGCTLREDAVASDLKEIDLTSYFGPLDPTVLINLILA